MEDVRQPSALGSPGLAGGTQVLPVLPRPLQPCSRELPALETVSHSSPPILRGAPLMLSDYVTISFQKAPFPSLAPRPGLHKLPSVKIPASKMKGLVSR